MAECKHTFGDNYVISDLAYTQVGLLSYFVTGAQDLSEMIAEKDAAKVQARNLKRSRNLEMLASGGGLSANSDVMVAQPRK